MAEREPVAFFSYVRSDDDHDSGRISELRECLEGEVKMQTGRTFHIFQDRNDIRWGEQWKERIEDAIFDVTFLIPIVTPSYFQSHACRTEFETFLVREKALGEERLILPIYYVSCDEMDEGIDPPDPIAKVLRARNWADWRKFRFETLTSPAVRVAIASLATTIKSTMKELEAVFAASKADSLVPAKSLPMPSITPALTTVLPTPYAPEVPVVRGRRFSQKILDQVAKNPYYAYTTRFDEIITPSEISEPSETMRLHTFLLNSLRKEIDAYQDQIAARTLEISETRKEEDLAISLLIDNSGSMREKVIGIACWASIISNVASQATIPNEVLGFTTRAWKGGRSREQWISDGIPERPGRLNDLRHIIYKSFEQTFQEADTNFGLMMREGLLKENIDGEALLWAYSRFEKHSSKRKLLFVLSDGAPVDDSTLSVNPSNFLDAHTIATINRIKTVTDIELYGIGIEHDVSRYYGPGSPTLSATLGTDLLTVMSLAITRNWLEAGTIQRKSLPRSPRPKPPRPSRPTKRRSTRTPTSAIPQ
jgi:cobaltochelatase CobT